MAKVKLTKTIVESIKPADRDVIVWDSSERGFHLKVTPAGRRIYYVYYRTAAGQQRRYRICEHGQKTVEEARAKANAIRGQASDGKDPAGERFAARRQQRLDEFWPRYRADAATRWKPRTAEETDRMWTLHIQPRLGALPLSAITRHEVSTWHGSMAKTPAVANRSLGVLKAMLNRARDWGLLEGDNPTSRIRLYPERIREVMLSQDQLVALARAICEEEALGGVAAVRRGAPEKTDEDADAEPTPPKVTRGGKGLKELESRGITPWAASLFRLLIFTGARLREIMDARWAWVDWERHALRLPDSKTGKKAVWLNPMALEELRRLHAIRRQDEWIIEGRVRGARMVNPQKPWRRVRERAAVLLKGEEKDLMQRLRIHDLRHSFASIAVASGIPLALVGKTLGHAKAKTTERYAHIADDPTRRAAVKTGAQIKKLLSSKAKVQKPKKDE